MTTDEQQRATSHHVPHEIDEAAPAELPAIDEQDNRRYEDHTAGSEGGGRTVGLGGHERPKYGSPAKPMREGH